MVLAGVAERLGHVGDRSHPLPYDVGRRISALLHRPFDQRHEQAGDGERHARWRRTRRRGRRRTRTVRPDPAPIASIAPQRAPNRRLPFFNSSGVRTRLGRPACAAGPTNEPSAEIMHRQAKPRTSVPVRVDEQQPGGRHHLERRHDLDDPATVVAVGRRSGHRRHQERRQRLGDVDERDEQRRVDQPLHEADERDVGEPVAHVRHHLGDEQRADVRVRSEQGEHRCPV